MIKDLIPFDIALLRYDPLYILELEGKDKRKLSITKEDAFLAASYMRDEKVTVRKTQHNYIIHFSNLTKDEIKSQLEKEGGN